MIDTIAALGLEIFMIYILNVLLLRLRYIGTQWMQYAFFIPFLEVMEDLLSSVSNSTLLKVWLCFKLCKPVYSDLVIIKTRLIIPDIISILLGDALKIILVVHLVH